MIKQPILLSPEDVNILVQCPLHYHFAQQKSFLPGAGSDEARVERLVRDTIQQLHAAGGPARVSLDECLIGVAHEPAARQMMSNYYRRLEQDWARMMASNETMSLKIVLSGVPLELTGTLDRLDRTSDGGILAILFRMGAGPAPAPPDLRNNPAMTIYHALTAATYPLKRPVRMQELWLQPNEEVTIELSEDEYRDNLSRLREPVQALARGEVRARPGSYCDVCPFQYRGCPVYIYDPSGETEADDFEPPGSDGKITPRKWIFKI